MALIQYKDKMAVRSSYLHNEKSYTGSDDIFSLNQGPGHMPIYLVATGLVHEGF